MHVLGPKIETLIREVYLFKKVPQRFLESKVKYFMWVRRIAI